MLQFLAILFFGVRIYGRENIPRKGPALLLTNHQSFLDPWLIGIALYRQIHFVARESLFRGGFVQYVLERTNAFPIKRGRADASAMRESLEIAAIRENCSREELETIPSPHRGKRMAYMMPSVFWLRLPFGSCPAPSDCHQLRQHGHHFSQIHLG